MPKKIFIGGLSVQTTSEDLKKVLGQSGTVLSLNMDGRSEDGAGTASAEMSTDEETQHVIRLLNGTELSGSRMIVREAE